MIRTDDEVLEARLRATLHRVAVSSTPVRRRRHRPLLTMGAIVVVASSVVAWNAIGPGEIDRIPTERAVMSGVAADGSQWWMIPAGAVVDGCDGRTPGVVFVSAELNRPGAEWNMGGVAYGEPSASNFACAPPDQASWLRNPTRYSYGHQRLGEDGDLTSDIGIYGTVHASVRIVRVTSSPVATFDVRTVALPEDPGGPRYVAFTLLNDTSRFTIELVAADGSIVAEHVMSVG